MKTTIAVCGAIILLSAVTFRAEADIIAGPITNPANGHDYYLLSPNTWTLSEAEAERLGGTLAIIKNAGEQKWVFSTFGAYPGVNHGGLWIGLHRTRPAGPFAWVTDEKLDYVNWDQGEPNNVGGVENCTHMQNGDSNHGAWNDLADNNLLFGVVELPSEANEKSLSKQERVLIGTWYESGNGNRPCWITGTENKLFQIYDGRAVRLILTAEGSLFLSNRIRGEVVKDKILWSNGTWWSRKLVEYGKNGKFSDKATGSGGSQN